MAARDFSTTPLTALRAGALEPQDLIAPHFSVYELSVSDLADRRGIDNRIIDDAVLRAAVHLARTVLEPIRSAFGGFTPKSVFRCQALERQLKDKPASWISTSQHTEGRACDVEIAGKPTLEFAQWAQDHLAGRFDQIVCECYDPRKGPNSGWVHISAVPPGKGRNRGQVLSYVVEPASGRLVVVNGLQPTMA
jgi:hypothetical protein